MKPLQHKKHTPAKRFLSLLCVLALCLGLLPVTALAEGETAPARLYVGRTPIASGYWTSNDGGTTWTQPQQSDQPPENNYIYYDSDSATLTLKGATIKGDNNSVESKGAGIYALCESGQSVSLTIVLIGENTIEGNYGILVEAQQGGITGIDASLIIKSESGSGSGSSSLNVTGSNFGISVKSGTGDASLTIENTTVNASTSGVQVAGVYVQSGVDATSSPRISLAVNGGSLTASGGASSGGIQFYVGSLYATGAATSLTVGGNAIVDAKTGGISASDPNSDISNQIKVSSDGTNGGIVFDGTEGTVYGNVTLDKSLTINEGETLTIPGGSKLNCNNKLTNNGTILVESGGNLSGSTTLTTPTITTDPTDKTVTEGETATFTVATDSSNPSYQWQQSTDSGSSWADISGAASASYTTAATTTDMDGYQYRCVVTNSSGVGVISNAATLTVEEKTVPVTGVSLDKTSLSLYTGDSATLTAAVQPDNATNKNVTWASDKPEVATVENGTVTAVGAGTATITVTTEDGNYIATCKVTVTDKTYAISADPTALDFGSAYTGYGQPAAQTVTLTNTGNQQVTVTLPTANDFIITAGTGFTDGSAAIKPGETATFTVQPKAGLAAGTYSETIEVTSTEGAAVTISASFTVTSRPSYNPPTVSEETTDAIADAQPGDTVTVDLSSGDTTLDKEVFETLAGKDVTLVVELGDGLSWTVNGSDIPENADFTDIDMGVTMNSDGIPVDVVNAITGEHGSVQIELAHDGAFGFTMTLTAPLGAENAGYWANLYHFSEEANAMTFETAAEIGDDGSVSLLFSHASQYAIVIDDHNHGVVTLPFTDVSEGDWFYDPVCFVYSQGLMTGTSATTFEPNTSLTRAMLVAMLHRLEGSPAASGGDFTDVSDGDWYAQAVNWAASVGVVNGFDDGTFQPNAAITREQMAAILRNFAQYKGMDVSASGSLTTYTDAANVSDWAQESVEWMVGNGLLGGYEDNTLRPQGTTTRAEVASVLQRALGNVAGNQ